MHGKCLLLLQDRDSDPSGRGSVSTGCVHLSGPLSLQNTAGWRNEMRHPEPKRAPAFVFPERIRAVLTDTLGSGEEQEGSCCQRSSFLFSPAAQFVEEERQHCRWPFVVLLALSLACCQILPTWGWNVPFIHTFIHEREDLMATCHKNLLCTLGRQRTLFSNSLMASEVLQSLWSIHKVVFQKY